jgi:hypothetical protein
MAKLLDQFRWAEGTERARGASLRSCRAVSGERHAVKDYFPVDPQSENLRFDDGKRPAIVT